MNKILIYCSARLSNKQIIESAKLLKNRTRRTYTFHRPSYLRAQGKCFLGYETIKYFSLIKSGPNSCGNNIATKLKQEIYFDNTHFPFKRQRHTQHEHCEDFPLANEQI